MRPERKLAAAATIARAIRQFALGAGCIPIEALEGRRMLDSTSASQNNDNQALANISPFAPIIEQYEGYLGSHNGEGAGFVPQNSGTYLLSDDGLAIEAFSRAGASPYELNGELAGLNLTNAHVVANGVAGYLPYSELDALSGISTLEFARPVRVRLFTGSVTSQGDAAIRADIARSTYGYTGAGVKVGVISDSFDTSGVGSYGSDISSGDLPNNVQVLQDYFGVDATDEGRAMLQMVYDSAPGASLAFATAGTDQSTFANNILALRNAGAKVIIDDIAFFDEPMFEDGIISQAVDNVVATGSVYLSAAGNEANQSYESAFRTGNSRGAGSISGTGSLSFLGGVTHDFDPGAGIDDMQQLTIPASGYLDLSFQWDQPYGTIPGSASCANNMDIYLLNSTGTSVVAAATTNNVGNDPIEVLQYQNILGSTQTYQLMIVNRSGAAPGFMKYVDLDGEATYTQFTTNSPSIFGHPTASGAIAVGAAWWDETPAFGTNPPLIEPYSTRGPITIRFNTSGSPITSVRSGPQIVAADGGNTSFFGEDDMSDTDSFPNFYGTSAAAPTAGAVVALMLQANPSLTPAQVLTILENTALDMDNPDTVGFDTGFDNATGYGLIRADQALLYIINPTGTITGTVYEDRNASGTFDAGDTTLSGVSISISGASSASTTSNGSGAFTFSSVPNGSYTITETLPSGYILTTGSGSLSASVAGNTVSGQNFYDFPTVFGTASNDNYKVDLSVAGGNGTAYSDNFNRSGLAGGNYNYTTVTTAGDGGSLITGTDIFTLTNDASGAGNNNGIVYVYTPTSAFANYNQTLNLNSSLLTWTFNMRQIRPNPGGFSAGSYGAAFILGSTASSFDSSGNGYAVVVGNNSSPDPIRLVRFTGGLTGTISTIAQNAAQDMSTNYYSIKVTYNPSGNFWSLYTRLDGASAFTNPLTGGAYTQSGSTTADSNYTGTALSYLGAYWSYSSSASQTAFFDNFNLAGVPIPAKFEVYVNNILTYSIPKTMLTSVAFNTGNGDDSLTIDYVNGSPIPTSGLTFNGGATSTSVGNQLLISGTSATDAFTLTSSSVSRTSESAVNYSNTTSLTIDGVGGSDTFTVNSTPATATAITISAPGTASVSINETSPNSPVIFAASTGLDTLSVNSDNTGSAAVVFNTTQAINSLSIGGGGSATITSGGHKSLKLNTFSTVSTGYINLNDGGMIVQAMSESALRVLIVTGRGGTDFGNATWNGAGINSSAAAQDGITYAIGYVPNTRLPQLGHSSYTSFMGQTVDSSSVLIRYTLAADTNLDGTVNSDDVTVIGLNYNSVGTGDWYMGDLDYDGACDSDDVTALGLLYDPNSPPLSLPQT